MSTPNSLQTHEKGRSGKGRVRTPLSQDSDNTEFRENRGDCPSFGPLLNAFIGILLNNNPELQLVQELAKNMLNTVGLSPLMSTGFSVLRSLHKPLYNNHLWPHFSAKMRVTSGLQVSIHWRLTHF
jgi:hypothetical protein